MPKQQNVRGHLEATEKVLLVQTRSWIINIIQQEIQVLTLFEEIVHFDRGGKPGRKTFKDFAIDDDYPSRCTLD